MNVGRAVSKLSLPTVLVLAYGVLLLPIAMVVASSVTAQPFPTVPETVDFRWYGELLGDSRIHSTLATSFVVATLSSIAAAVIGTISAFGFVRYDFPYKEALSTAMILPLIISPIITGVAILQFASRIGVSTGYPTLVAGHTVLVFPYVFLIIRSALSSFDTRLEDASVVMGATPTASFVNVTLPTISPAIVSAVLVAFLVSFGEFTATQFLVSADATTVPVVIYTMMRTGVTPVITALGTVLIAFMIAVGVVSEFAG
jgi:ABC-type spermidine/putrescine transport system permease subunit II